MSRGRRRGFAQTSADASDPRLRGRTYAVPFEDVWQAALRITGGGLFRWTRHEEDDYTGEIRATSKSLLGAHDIEIHVGLDENGQTRVDASAAARHPLGDFGRAKRRLNRFFRTLDKALDRRGDRNTATAPRSSKAAPHQ